MVISFSQFIGEGGAERVQDERRNAGSDALSNAFLPGMFRDTGFRPPFHAPPDDGRLTAAGESAVICPGALERLPVFVCRNG